MLRSPVGVCALALTLVSAMSTVSPAQALETRASATCQATPEKPVVVCFEPQPLTVDHCSQTLVPHFDIDVWTPPDQKPSRYRYSYQALLNGANTGRLKEVSDPDNPKAYPFSGRTEGEKPTPDEAPTIMPYSGRASYNLRVAVSVDGKEPVGFVSPDVPPLEDKPRIRGLAIGISNYNYGPSLKLNYADADAAAFKKAITRLFSAEADVDIEQRTSDMQGSDKMLTKDAIVHTLEEVVSGVQLCGPNDWYVFYFSGHGIVGVNRQEKVGRYLSTKAFNPADLTRTSIRMTDLVAKLSGTGAKNLLVVLDSCFSGFHIKPGASTPVNARGARSVTSAPAAPTSGKVKYVSDGVLRTSRIEGDADSDVLYNSTQTMEQEQTRAWILTAAGSNTEAEEGPVSYGRVERDGDIVLAFTRASVADNAGKPGHGLYTFALLSNLFAQLPRGANVSDLLPGSRTPAGPVQRCTVDLDSAASKAKEDIKALAKEMTWELQVPEAKSTKTTPPTIDCVITPSEEP